MGNKCLWSKGSAPVKDDTTEGVEYCSGGVKRKASEHGEGELDLNLVGKESASSDSGIADFEAKYKEQDQLGHGGHGTVFGGYRKADNLPVAIKHIPKKYIDRQHNKTGQQLPMEVAIMLKLLDKRTGSVGMSALVSLLDWYDLDQELILVLERPIPAEDLFDYIYNNGGSLQEQEAKIILKQLVDAAIYLKKKGIFHRDIKSDNILIETSSDVPRVRLIDFGISCFVKRGVRYPSFHRLSIYSPPELSHFGSYIPGPSTVWQIGVVLSHTLHGDVVFTNPEMLMNGGRISETLSKNCQDFLGRCIITDPKQRPTLKQLRIHPWLNCILDPPTTAPPPGRHHLDASGLQPSQQLQKNILKDNVRNSCFCRSCRTPSRPRRGDLSLNCLSRGFFSFSCHQDFEEFFLVFLESLGWVKVFMI